MKVLKIDDDDLAQACRKLKENNAIMSSATKAVKDAKTIIRQKLIELRDVDVNALEMGEIVSIDKLLLIEIGKQSRFNEAQFGLDQAELYEQYKKDFPVVKYKPLV